MKRKYLKIISISLALLIALPVSALGVEYSVEGMEKLSGRSPSVMLVDYNVAALPDEYDYDQQYKALSSSLANIQYQITVIDQVYLDAADGSTEEKIAWSTLNVLMLTRSNLQQSMASVQGQMATAKMQLLSAKAKQAGVKGLITYNAEQLLLSYYELSGNERELRANLNKLERQNEKIGKMIALGLVSELDGKKLEASLSELKTSQKTLENGKKAMLGNLNVLLGYNFSEQATVAAFRKVTDEELSSIKTYEAGLKSALDNNENLEKLNELAGELDRLYNSDVINYSAAAAETNALDTKRKAEASFFSVYNEMLTQKESIKTAKKSFELAGKEYDISKKKYELGMLSKDQFDDAKDDYELASIKYDAAEISLKKAYRAYVHALNGIVIGK